MKTDRVAHPPRHVALPSVANKTILDGVLRFRFQLHRPHSVSLSERSVRSKILSRQGARGSADQRW